MNRCGKAAAQTTMLLGLASAVMAEPDLSGDWEGSIQTAGPALDILLTFTLQEEDWTGVIDIPQQSIQDLPLSAVEVHGDSVLFGLPGVPGTRGSPGWCRPTAPRWPVTSRRAGRR